MDPLSDVLSLLKPHSYQFRGFEAAGEWSIRFGALDGIKCYAVVSGACRLAVDGVAEAVDLRAGDCFLLPRGLPFRLASDLGLPSVDALAVFSTPVNGGMASLNGGGEVFGVGGHISLAGDTAHVLLSVLPPIVHIREESDKAALRWCMDRIRQELREARPGGFLALEHLAHMMLLEALRAHLEAGAGGRVGWLPALADKRMAAAIEAMHDDPGRRWTLQALAARAGMSRSSFALRFKQTVGSSPMDYLTGWRMLLAGNRLAHDREPLAALALSLGYESESAFSAAFKRVMGCSPRRYGPGAPGGVLQRDPGLGQGRRARATAA